MARLASRISELTGEAHSPSLRAPRNWRAGPLHHPSRTGRAGFSSRRARGRRLAQRRGRRRDRYVSPRGIPALREAVADYLKRTRAVDAAPEQVLIAPGCKMALSLAMMALIEPADEVLYPILDFHLSILCPRPWRQSRPIFLEEKNHFQPDIAEIAEKISPRTKVLIFNSPNNPTGTVFSDAALSQVAELACSTICGSCDEIYARILFSGVYKSIWSLPGMASAPSSSTVSPRALP